MPQPQFDIHERAFRFGLRIVRMVASLKPHRVSRVLGDQVLRSGTSIGANLAEADAAFTKSDFRYLVNLARREACETHYWLRMLAESGLVHRDRLGPLIQETEELIKILSSIVRKTAPRREA